MCSQWKGRNIEWAVQTPRIVLYFVLNEEGTRSSAAQRNRAMLHVVAYIAKLFKITQGHHSKWERNPYFVSRIVSEIFRVKIWYDLEIWVSVTEGHLKRRKKTRRCGYPTVKQIWGYIDRAAATEYRHDRQTTDGRRDTYYSLVGAR